MIKILNLLIIFLMVFNAFAQDGPGTSGGGDHEFGDFYYLSDILFADFKNNNVTSEHLALTKKALEELRKAKGYPKFTLEKLVIDNKEVTAINDYAAYSLMINTPRWSRSSHGVKRLVILHELLGLARKYDKTIDDSKFDLSGDLLSRLEKKNQRNLLLDIDYPAIFSKPEITNLNTISISEIKVAIAPNKESLPITADQSCLPVNSTTPTVTFKFNKKLNTDKYTMGYAIHCKLPNKIFGHRQYSDGFSLASGNLIEINPPDLGSLIIGWISGKNLLARTSGTYLKLIENSDQEYDFIFEHYIESDDPAEQSAYRVTAKIKPDKL